MKYGFLRHRIHLGLVAVLMSGLAFGSANAFGQAAASKDNSKKTIAGPEEQSLTTRDGVRIKITYYKSTLGKDAAVVVLLHMKDGNRFIWQGDKGLATRLQSEGYAVITVDLRGHGESKDDAGAAGNANQAKKGAGKRAALKQEEVRAMVLGDMEAVKNFIYDEHQAENLNMNKMAIVGPELGATVAVEFALYDWMKKPHADGQPGFQTPRGQDVQGLVLISPQTSYQGIVMPRALAELKNPQWNVSFLVCSGTDSQDKAQAKKVFDQITVPPENEKRMYKQEFPSKLHGTDLLGKGLTIENIIVGFLNKHIKPLDIPWRDRKSKLET
jgi:pimeloyl-ACP methyl ester carboxylesterase